MTKRRRGKAPSKRAMQRRKRTRVRMWWSIASYAAGPTFVRAWGALQREVAS